MLQHEISELLESTNMYEIANKTEYGIELNNDEKEVAAQLDEWARKIGKTGHDANHEIAAFVTRVVNDEIYEAPDELLDAMFERGSIGEFDDFEAYATPKNTLVAYEAAKGGNVPRSFLDISVRKPTWKNRQIESDLSYADLRRNGWKSVALVTEYATKAFKNAMFYDIFSNIDKLITSSAANCITESGAKPTETSMDALATYLSERNDPSACNIIGLYKYILAASKLESASDDMKNELHRVGLLGSYAGINMTAISSAKKVQGQLLVPDKRIFGVSGIVGNLDMKGEIHVYEDEDNHNERIHLMFKDFTYGFAFNDDTLENMCKIVLA